MSPTRNPPCADGQRGKLFPTTILVIIPSKPMCCRSSQDDCPKDGSRRYQGEVCPFLLSLPHVSRRCFCPSGPRLESLKYIQTSHLMIHNILNYSCLLFSFRQAGS